MQPKYFECRYTSTKTTVRNMKREHTIVILSDAYQLDRNPSIIVNIKAFADSDNNSIICT